MKKNLNNTLFFLIFTTCLPSFAFDEQLKQSSQFLEKNNILISKQEFLEIKKDISLNQKNKYVLALQKQFGIEETSVYDANMRELIISKQNDLGLNPTGIIDPVTFASIYDNSFLWKTTVINSAIDEWNKALIEQSKTSFEKFINVNIPSQTLTVYQKENNIYKPIFTTNVVVGSTRTPTPFNNFKITSLKYNPNWTPTSNMVKRNLFKGEDLNHGWISSHGLIAYDESGNKIDLDTISKENLPHRLVQPSGNSNALGKLKFETTSNKNIYLHDTNEKKLFGHNLRVASNGCIRVEDYLELASILNNTDEESIKNNINKNKMYFEKVDEVPVYFTYTQVVFNNNIPQFFPDVYNIKKYKEIVDR